MLTDLKREAYEANLALAKHGLITLTFGNASALDRDRGIFAIKPSGVSVAELRPALMVLVDLDGKKVEGRLNASSDMPTHRRLYHAFREIGGVAHTHSPYATAFAQAGRSIPIFGTTHADYFNGDIPITRKLTEFEISGSYEFETGNVIVERFLAGDLNPLDYPGVLVYRRAPFSWGPTAAEAVKVGAAMEQIAQLAMLTMQLTPKLKTIEPELLERHFNRKHGETAYYGQR